jgi:hypothetical protein
LNEAVADSAVPRLVKSHSTTRQQLLLTLLFMNIFGVQRPWELRSYAGDGLALLSGRKKAYGYAHTERFLAQLAHGASADRLTDGLARWSSALWGVRDGLAYVDGHKKAVYSDSLVPRSVVGRLGKVLGCRALTLLMDGAGHPLFVATARGDQHLTVSTPFLLARYEQAAGTADVTTLVIDREGMSADFLQALSEQYTVVTLLRANQYHGLESFSQVGEFSPLVVGQDGQVIRDVAPAQFALALPEQPGQSVPLSVALIRDWSQPVPVPAAAGDVPPAWDADLCTGEKWQFLQGHLEATPAPPPPTQPKLIPIVATSANLSPVELVAVYRQRWAAQENIIRDFLLPLGLDTNHGYAKTQVPNSEVAKVRATLQKRLDKARTQAERAYQQSEKKAQRYHHLHENAKQHSAQQQLRLADLALTLAAQGVPASEADLLIQREQLALDADLKARWQPIARAMQLSQRAFEKYQQATLRQREVLRDLETLDAHEHTMFELDNTKDHIMSVLKLMLVNLLMWTRDHFFPPDYAHATATTLLPFLRLPGRVLTFDDRVLVTLRPFNDRTLNRDLAEFCQRVNAAHLCLPTGKLLIFRVASSPVSILNVPP